MTIFQPYEQMDILHITIIQTNIIWENKRENLRLFRQKLEQVHGATEIVVLPEMFSTGFTMKSCLLAENASGDTLSTLKQWASLYQTAICGSYIAEDNGHFYNRFFFFTPEGEEYYYDKRHLFRMGQENVNFSSGNKRLIVPYHGWNICPLICYDLRFPVWSRNIDNEYDILIYIANWPASRRIVWDTLLRARALENQCYVCGVNRVGTDNNQIDYNGGSLVYSPLGEELTSIPDGEDGISTISLSLSSLRTYRNKFPVWKDSDSFRILCSD